MGVPFPPAVYETFFYVTFLFQDTNLMLHPPTIAHIVLECISLVQIVMKSFLEGKISIPHTTNIYLFGEKYGVVLLGLPARPPSDIYKIKKTYHGDLG